MHTGNPLRLSELNRLVGDVLEGYFRDQVYFLIAETSDINNYPERRQCYFNLIEKDSTSKAVIASMRASLWGNCYETIKQFEEQTGERFKDNIQLLLKAKVQYHPHYGLSVMVLEIDARYTLGKLALNRQAVLDRLLRNNPDAITFADGEYITRNKQLELKPVIQRIALITSASADGYHDFMKELTENVYGYAFKVDEYLAQVQGTEAHQLILDQLLAVHASGICYDAVVLVRGGGSQLDFSAYEDYNLARAVARFPIPVITGIGHERNECVVDMMACCKTKTPTKAAATILAHNRHFEEQILRLQKNLVLKTNELLAGQALTLQKFKNNLQINANNYLSDLQAGLQPLGSQLVQLTRHRLETNRMKLLKLSFAVKCAAENTLKDEHCRLMELSQAVKYLNPSNVLKRGYALVYANNRIITTAGNLKPGDTIRTILGGAAINSTITEIENHEGREINI